MGVDGSPDYAALISWDIQSIPATAVVESVQIQLQVTDRSTHSYPLYAVKRQWQEQQATWRVARQGVNWGTAGAQNATDRDTTQIGVLSAPNTGPATINLNAAGVALVQSWIASPAANLGVIIQNYSPATDGIDFASRESSTATSRPKLTVNYTLPAASIAAAARAEHASLFRLHQLQVRRQRNLQYPAVSPRKRLPRPLAAPMTRLFYPCWRHKRTNRSARKTIRASFRRSRLIPRQSAKQSRRCCPTALLESSRPCDAVIGDGVIETRPL